MALTLKDRITAGQTTFDVLGGDDLQPGDLKTIDSETIEVRTAVPATLQYGESARYRVSVNRAARAVAHAAGATLAAYSPGGASSVTADQQAALDAADPPLDADHPPLTGGADHLAVTDYLSVGVASFASGVLTLTGQPEVGDSVAINQGNYTFVAPGTSTPFEISIGTNVATAAQAIAAAINGTDGFNTPIADVEAVAGASTVTITGTVERFFVGFLTEYTNSGAGTNSFADATLQGGGTVPSSGAVRLLVDEYLTILDENGDVIRLIGFDSVFGAPSIDPDENGVLFGGAPIASGYQLRSGDVSLAALDFIGTRINVGAGFSIVRLGGSTVLLRVGASPIADADLPAFEVNFWLDNTPGSAKLMVQAKDDNGDVVTGEVALS